MFMSALRPSKRSKSEHGGLTDENICVGVALLVNMCVCVCIQVDMAEEPPGPLSWYRLVKYLISEEEKIALQIKASLVEVTTGSHQIFYPSGFLC